MSRPHAVPRYFPHIPPYSDARHAYALTLADQRVNFLLNNGSLSNPSKIYLITTETMYTRLNDACLDVFTRCLHVDHKRGSIILPKVCDLYKDDFGGEPMDLLRHILRYLGREQWESASLLISNGKQAVIKYHDIKFVSHDHIELVT